MALPAQHESIDPAAPPHSFVAEVERKRGLLDKLGLDTDLKRVVFARSVAQVVSIIAGPAIAHAIGGAHGEKKTAFQQWVVGMAQKNPHFFQGIDRLGLALAGNKERWKSRTEGSKAEHFADGLQENGLLFLANNSLSIAVSKILARAMGHEAKKGDILQNALILDTGVQLATMVGLPVFAANATSCARKRVEGEYGKLHDFAASSPLLDNSLGKALAGQMDTSQKRQLRALDLVNHKLPDFTGFAVGIGYLAAKGRGA